MEKLQTIRFKPSDVGKDVAGFCSLMDSRNDDEIIIRKSKETLEFFIYTNFKE